MDNSKPTPKILFYGKSILMETLSSKLQKVEGWDVKRKEGGEIRELGDVNFIVADLGDMTTSEVLPMLCALSGVTLIGVDAIANTRTVLTGRARTVRSMQEVLDAIKKAM